MCESGGVASTVLQASAASSPATIERTEEAVDLTPRHSLDTPWQTIVWNDPVNLMSYVVYVFRSYFGFSKEKATKLMLQVHHDGRTIVATGTREAMEAHVHAMHSFGLTATVERAEK
jgi:ATP-dependent Clp protease adaptor protein ClpS